jgi:hypothetical protein
MHIKTIWTFDPSYDKPTQDNLEGVLYPEAVRWLSLNYPLARDQLEHSSVANSAGRHEGAQTNFVSLRGYTLICSSNGFRYTLHRPIRPLAVQQKVKIFTTAG